MHLSVVKLLELLILCISVSPGARSNKKYVKSYYALAANAMNKD